MTEIKGSLTISRVSSGKGDFISLTLKDEASRVTFAEVRMDAKTLGNVITGLSEQKVDIRVKGLDRVGKVKITEPRTLTLPTRVHSKEEVKNILELTCQEEGWILDTYLGSQNSVKYVGEGETLVKYGVYRYEEAV